jgi:hypothetical protein
VIAEARLRLRRIATRARRGRRAFDVPQARADRSGLDVLAIHPPDYLGVAASTRRLFPRALAVGSEDLWLERDRRALVEAIESTDPDVLVLSGLSDGYAAIARACYARRPERPVRVLWHGAPMQLADADERRHYRLLLDLSRRGVVSRIGTFKTGQGAALAARGFDAVDVFNPPPAEQPVAPAAPAEPAEPRELAVGLFFAGPSWRKNPYAMLEACTRLGPVAVSGVLDVHAQAHARSIGLRLSAVRATAWPAAELPARLARVDLNLYVGLSECSPLLPLESLHLGIPCLVGPSSHLFLGSPVDPPDGEAVRSAAALLERLLVVPRPDDPDAIARSMRDALAQREEIGAAYATWQSAYRRAAWTSIEAFVGGRLPRSGTP